MGTNTIAGTDTKKIVDAANQALDHPVDKSKHRVPELWDGHAGDRIASDLSSWLAHRRARGLQPA